MEHTIIKIRELLESDAQRRKLYKEYLATQDALTLNRALKMLMPLAKHETSKLTTKVLNRINRNRVFKFKVQFSHTFIGAHDYVLSQVRFNTNTTPHDDRTVPESARGAFTLILYYFLNDDKTWYLEYGGGPSRSLTANQLSQTIDQMSDVVYGAGFVRYRSFRSFRTPWWPDG